MKKTLYYFYSIFELIFGIREWPLVIAIFLGLTHKQEYMIHLRKNGMGFTVRGPMDIWSLKETWIDRFYERYGCTVEKGWVVMDVGAGIGEFTTYAASTHPTTRVLAFEPGDVSYHLLCQNYLQNHLENIVSYQEAVWDQTGVLTLDSSGGEPLQFQSLDAEKTIASPDDRNLVPCTSLEEVINRSRLDRIDLLKLDCEGAEYRILLDASEATLTRIDRIVMEYHDNVNPQTHLDLARFLSGHGFSVRSVQNVVHPYLGYLYAFRSM